MRVIVAVLFAMLLSICPTWAGETPDADEVNTIKPTADKAAPHGVYVPKDLEDAFAELKRALHPKMVEIMKTAPEKEMIQYHFGLGMWMRNNWGLWGGSRLASWFNERGICHPDDMSGIILDSFWRHLNAQPLRLDEQVAHYVEYWKENGGDPCKGDAGE